MSVEAKRYGSRWFDGLPSSTEVAEWFIENARVPEGLKAEDYLSGVVLISQKQKMQVARESANGGVAITEVERLAHVPYVGIDARVRCFWDFMALHPEWIGVIEPAPVRLLGESAADHRNDYLPAGFFRYTQVGPDGKGVEFLGCSQQVAVYERESYDPVERIGKPIFAPTAGTKAVKMNRKYGPDDDAIMKCETSAVGRALGMLGVLTVGSGIASAEDMLEQTPAPGAPAAEAATLPDAKPTESARQSVARLSSELKSNYPDSYDEVESWARGRKIDLDALADHQIRPVLRRLETALAERHAAVAADGAAVPV